MFAAVLLAILDLGALFSEKAAWTDKAEFFAVEHAKEGFVFASEERDIVNSLRHDTCVCWGLPVWESKVYFDKSGDEEKIIRVELSLYNRGDAKTPLFTEGLKEKLAVLAKYLVPKGRTESPVEKTKLKSGGFSYRRPYANGDLSAEAAWGLSGPSNQKDRVVEYLRLTLFAKDVSSALRGTKRPAGKATSVKLKENVTKSPNGDVFVGNVPMVNQGQKGYCSAAVSERVLRYYGNRIDEHEIAQQAGTTAEGGTSVSAMKEVVRSVGEKNGLGFQSIVSMFYGMGDIEEEVARYNKAAKIEKKPELSLAAFTRDHTVYVGELRAAMEARVVYQMRQKDARFKKFSAGVRQQVNLGIPIFWGVTLGIFPERGVNPQTQGGHMRLIIGYNDKKKEILYTDSWGEGHELKRMPEDWAFAITDDAFFLKPR